MRQRAGRYIIPVSLRSVIFNAIIMSEPQRVTLLLAQWAKGSQKALNELTRYVYPKLRQLAASHLRKESVDHTLQPTALLEKEVPCYFKSPLRPQIQSPRGG